jgi:hypothetical protein
MALVEGTFRMIAEAAVVSPSLATAASMTSTIVVFV